MKHFNGRDEANTRSTTGGEVNEELLVAEVTCASVVMMMMILFFRAVVYDHCEPQQMLCFPVS